MLIYKKRGRSLHLHRDPDVAKEWCETTSCPTVAQATIENCCIYHMNIHSCPLSDPTVKNGLCGPWIPASGQIITHSEGLVGKATVGNWTNYIPGLYMTGQTSIIAHFRVAGTNIALFFSLYVNPKSGKNVYNLHIF